MHCGLPSAQHADTALALIMGRLAELCGGALPVSYIVLDLETTSLDTSTALPYELALLVVRDGHPDERASLFTYLDWSFHCPDYPSILRAADRRMRADGLPGVPVDAVLESGLAPARAFATMAGELRRCPVLIAHNGYGFDIPVLRSVLERHPDTDPDCALSRALSESILIDTGLIEKANMLSVVPEPDPPDLADPRSALQRLWALLRDRRAHVPWSLHRHCLVRYGIELPDHLHHTARHDAYAVHRLYETMRGSLNHGRHHRPDKAAHPEANRG